MEAIYASEFAEIPTTLTKNQSLSHRMVALIASEPMPGKVTEGGDRLAALRTILRELVQGNLSLDQAIHRARKDLRRGSSPHAASNHVFASGWEERLVRTQLSRFYNQAVLDELMERGVETCFVPHSAVEAQDTQCSRLLAGRVHPVRELRRLLIESYAMGKWSNTPKIPDHPHCTHVVKPLQ